MFPCGVFVLKKHSGVVAKEGSGVLVAKEGSGVVANEGRRVDSVYLTITVKMDQIY